MMASATGPESPLALLDLSFLTEEERVKIESVVQADQELRTRDRIRLGTMRQEVEQRQHKQRELTGRPVCACCEQPFGRLFNTGANCPVCGARVCKQCRRIPYNRHPVPFMCTVCAKKRILDLQSTSAVPATPTQSNTPYGSDLILMSLEVSKKGATLPRSRGSPRPTSLSVGSQSSAIVVRYAETGTESPLAAERRSSVSSARRASLSDLSDSDQESEGTPAPPAGQLRPPPGLEVLRRSDSLGSIGSMASMYSASGGKGDYDITGDVLLGVWHKDDQLFIRVAKVRGLAAAKSSGISDPYVKTYLLPDRTKHSKRKTGVQRKTLNPVYNEILKNKLPRHEVASHTLWLSVWDWDRFGRNQFLGEVRLPLSMMDLTNAMDRWYKLQDKDESAQEADMFYRGKLHLGLMFAPDESSPRPPRPKGKRRLTRGTLHVKIIQAEELPVMDTHSLTDATVKCYLLPNQSSSGKRKTLVVKNSLNPTWDESFTYSTSLEELRGKRVLEVTVWDYDRRGSNDFIGGLRLGPTPTKPGKRKEWMDSVGDEVSHWESVLARPGEWVEQWHTLRPSMDPLGPGAKPMVFPVRTGRVQELSPVEEASPTHEKGEGLPTMETYSFTPPITPPGAPPIISPAPPTGDAPPSSSQAPPTGVAPPIISRTPPTSRKRTSVPELVITETTPRRDPAIEALVGNQALLRHRDSLGSTGSLYSENGWIKGDYDISGEVRFGVFYKEGQLVVHVSRARGLAAADSNGLSDPYIKTYLLPDKSKHSKRKTSVKRKTLDPVYNETLQYKVPRNEVASRTLWVSVWDWDRFGRNKFLGEVRLPLSSADLDDKEDRWYILHDKEEAEGGQMDAFYRGELFLGLMFAPRETKKGRIHGTLHMAIKEARDLPKMDDSGLADGFVKCYLLPDKSSGGKRKTGVVKNNLNPVWGEQFSYEKVVLDELSSERVLEVTVWDWDRGSSNDFIGGLRLGPAPGHTTKRKEWMDSIGDEVSHWESALARPGEWVEQWHTLRTTMDPRSIDLSALPKPSPPRTTEELHRKEAPVEDLFGAKITIGTPKGSLSGRGTSSKDAAIDNLPESLPRSSPVLTKPVSQLPKKRSQEASPPEPPPPVPQTVVPPPSLSSPPEVAKPGNSTAGEEPSAHAGEPTATPPLQSPVIPVPVVAVTAPGPSPPKPRKETSPPAKALTLSTGSFGSMASVYSATGGEKGDYDISGEVRFGVFYKDGQLVVHVSRARGLAAADSNGLSDPYIKTYLLPDKSKHSKRKTSIKKKTLDPVYNETLKYKVPLSDVTSHTLWLSVWDWDRFGQNQFLGEVRLPLSSADLNDKEDHWHTLQDRDDSGHGGMDAFYRGELQLGLRFQPSERKGKKGLLTVAINQARDLPAMETHGLVDAAVKCYLLPDKSSGGKRKTGVVKNNLNPVWGEQFSYEASSKELSLERVLQVSVWDYEKRGSDFIGGLRLGPAPRHTAKHKEWMDSIGDEVSHWEAVLARPGEWVEQWHTLRPSMAPRNISFSPPPPEPAPLPLEEEFHKTSPQAAQTPGKGAESGAESEQQHRTPTPQVRTFEDEFHKVSVQPHSPGPQPVPPRGQDPPPKTVTTPLEPASSTPVSVRTRPLAPSGQDPTPYTHSSDHTPSGGKSPPPGARHSTPQPPEPVVHAEEPPQLLSPIVPTVAVTTSSPQGSLEDNLEEEATPRKKGLLSQALSAASIGSLSSIYSAAGGGKGDYDISGEVRFGVFYKEGQLVVHVSRARGLAAADSNGLSDPYIKTYLLPDKSKHSKRKTSVKRKTLDPVYNETLKYKISRREALSHTVWLSVWDWDRFGRNQFLGEVRLPLSSADLDDKEDHWHTLQDREEGPEDAFYRGQLLLGVMFQRLDTKKGKQRGTLNILVKQARELPSTDSKGLADGFVKCYLLPDKSSGGKRKTEVVKNDPNPVWDARFSYEKVLLDELSSERVLQLTVWDQNKGSSSDFIGGLRLGPAPGRTTKRKEWMDSIGDEVSHWESALARPGEWVEQWHTLRTTMDPRSVAHE